MSGICGIVSFGGHPIPAAAAATMAAAAAHRGRDGTHDWTTPTIQVLHQATHITAQPERSQPVQSSDGRHVLVGTIRLDAKADLIRSLGLQQRPRSDAELVLAAFEKWGAGCVARILGDFAFVIVDQSSHRVLAARDVFGVRPLYYRLEAGRRLIFATEAAQVLAAPDVPVSPFEPAIAAHLAGPLGRPEWSFYDGVDQLPGGSLLEVSPDGRGRVRRFWRREESATIHYRSEQEYADHFREVFFAAVADRMHGERPIGIQLSGGMDSGSTASVAGRIANAASAPTAIRTYSYAFSELADADERAVSDEIVRAFGLAGEAVPADHLWPLAEYPDHGPVRDDPFVLVYTAANDAVRSRARADGVGLMLVPERGDEVIGTQWVTDYLRLIDAHRPGLLWDELRAHGTHTEDSLASALFRYVLVPLASRFRSKLRRRPRSGESRPSFPRWIRPEFAARTNLADTIAEHHRSQFEHPGAVATRQRTVFSLSGQRWATDLERRHAHAGLGYSDPFSDRRVVEFVLSIPQTVINRPADDSKRLLRRAMEGVMPPRALNRAGKLLPTSLFARGFYERGRPVLTDLTSMMHAADHGYVDQAVAAEVIAGWTSDNTAPPFDPWWLITLEWWLRSHW